METSTKETYAYGNIYKRDVFMWIQITTPIHIETDQIHMKRSTKEIYAYAQIVDRDLSKGI